MLCLFTVAGVVGFIVAVVFLIALVRSDGDLLLMFKARYGKKPDSLAGKVIWITGASSGIGEYISYCLADAGCRLVLSARRKDELEKVKQKCLQSNKGKISESDILVLPLDLLAFDTHKAAVQKVLETFNKIDVLVNNAGRSQRALWMDVELSVDRELFEINVLGPVSLTQEVLPHMIQRKQGHIVAVSSILGKIGAPTVRSYTGAKHALHGYFESLRTEIGEHKIDVTIVCPGPVVSNIAAAAVTGKSGEVNKKTESIDKSMATDRCAYLTSVAIANKLYESWVAEHPTLFFAYLFQYFPDVGRWIGKTFGKRIMARRIKSE